MADQETKSAEPNAIKPDAIKPSSWASFTNVDRPSPNEQAPEAFRKPPFVLKAAVVFYLVALAAMVVVIAVLKQPGS